MHHLLSFFPRPPQRDYVTRRRAILVYLLSIVSLNKNPPYSGFESVSVRLVSLYDYRDVVDTREVFHLNGIKISEESLDLNLSRIMQVCFTSSIRTKQDITRYLNIFESSFQFFTRLVPCAIACKFENEAKSYWGREIYKQGSSVAMQLM